MPDSPAPPAHPPPPLSNLPSAWRSLLLNGSSFTQHRASDDGLSCDHRPVHLTFDPSSAAFIVQPLPHSTSASSPLSSHPLRLLTDIFVSRRCPLQSVSPAPDGVWWSLSFADAAAVELEAECPLLVERWVEALQALLTSTGQPLLIEGGAGTGEEGEEEIIDAEEALQSMTAGAAFTLLTLSDAGQVQPIPVWLSYEAASLTSSPSSPSSPLGCVVWAEGRASLDELSDVFLGAQSASFQSLPPSLPPPSPLQCLSLVFSSLQLDLIAADERTLNRWLAGINRILTAGGKSTVVQEEEEVEAEGEQGRPDSGGHGSQGVRRQSRLSVVSQPQQPTMQGGSGEDGVRRMKLGSTMTRFSMVDGVVRREVGVLRYEEEEEEEEKAEETTLGRLSFTSALSLSLSLPLLSLTDVYVGQQTRVWGQMVAAASQAPPPHLCFSLLSTDAEWDLQADDESTLNQWLTGIHHLLIHTAALQLQETPEDAQPATQPRDAAHTQEQGHQNRSEEALGGERGRRGGEEREEVEEPVPAAAELLVAAPAPVPARPSFSLRPSSRAAASSSSSAQSSSASSASFALLSRGEWFELLQLSLPPPPLPLPAASAAAVSVSVRRVFVFLNASASRAGCLYWTASSEVREERVGQSLALHTLTEVWTGAKALRAWEERGGAAGQPSSGSCLSLMSRRERSCMHLSYSGGGGGGRGGAAEGERVVKAWVSALRCVLHDLGATVKGKQQPQPTVAHSQQRLPIADADADALAPPSASPFTPPHPPPSPTPLPPSSLLLPPAVMALIAPLLRPSAMSLLTSTALYPISLCLSTEPASSPTLTYRHLSPSRSSKPKRLSLRRVTDLYLGFSSPSLLSSGWLDGAKVQGTRVWSVVTRKACWDLCADSEQQRGAWVAALRELILAVTRKRVVDEVEGEKERERQREREQSTATATSSQSGAPDPSAPRRMSFQPSSVASAAPSSPSVSSTSSAAGAAALASLTSGLRFVRYEAVDGLTFRQPILLFYRQRRAQGRQAEDVLYWCDAASSSLDRSSPPTHPSCCLAIDRITDIYLGKQTPLLLAAAATAQDTACIALISPHMTIELEGTEEEGAAETLLEAVQFICADGGRAMEEQKAQEALSAGREGQEGAEAQAAAAAAERRQAELAMLARKGAKGGKRFSLGPALQGAAVNRRLSALSSRLSMLATHEDDDALALPVGASTAALMTGEVADVGLLLREWSSRSCGPSLQSLLSVMQEGRIFTGYTSDSRGRYHQSTLLLFLSLTPPTLHWCPYGVKQTHANASLPLASLGSVQLGKLSPALSSPLARDAPADRCIALHSHDGHLQQRGIELEARHQRLLLAFLIGLHSLLAQQGKELRGEGGERQGRRLVVQPLPSPPPPSSTPLQSPREALSVAAPIPPPPPKPSLRTTGLPFELIALHPSTTLSNSTSSPSSSSSPHPRRPVLLFFTGDALHWTGPFSPLVPVPSRSLPLRSIRDIYCGNMTTASKASAALLPSTPSDAQRCVSVIARGGVELHLIAATTAEVRSLVAELMALLKHSGKTVTGDDGDAQRQRESGAAAPAATAAAAPAPLSPAPGLNARSASTASASAPPPLPSRPAVKGSTKGGSPGSSTPMASAAIRGGDKENRTAPARRLSVVSASRGQRRSVLLSPAQSAQRMMEGRRFLLYSNERGEGLGGVTKRSVLVSYHPSSHSLHVTATNSPSATRALSSFSSALPPSPLVSVGVRQLVEVVLGKQTPLFLHSACAAVDRTRCVCLCAAEGLSGDGPLLQLHLEADSAAALSSWLIDLQQLLSLQGKNVVVESQKTHTEHSAGTAAETGGRGGGEVGGGGAAQQLRSAAGLDPSCRRFSIVNKPPIPLKAPIPTGSSRARSNATPNPTPASPAASRTAPALKHTAPSRGR